MQARQCGGQMGTKFWEVVCDEHAAAAAASTAAIMMRSSTTSACFTTKPMAASTCPARCSSARRRCDPKSPLGVLLGPNYVVNQNAVAGNNWAKALYTKAGHEFC